jgi:hypothetical protein
LAVFFFFLALVLFFFLFFFFIELPSSIDNQSFARDVTS